MSISLNEILKMETPEYGALLCLCPSIQKLKTVSTSIVISLRMASDTNRSLIPKIIRDLDEKGALVLNDFEDNLKLGTNWWYIEHHVMFYSHVDSQLTEY